MSDIPALPHNRSMPDCAVIPVLAYPDVPEAVAWLCRVFGLRERLRIGTHRVQLSFGNGAIVVTGSAGDIAPAGVSLMLRVADVDAHYRHALAAGAEVSGEPVSFPYGERQYSAIDPGGHTWKFSQTINDADPASWGGELIDAAPAA